MFTGIIEARGEILELAAVSGFTRIRMRSDLDLSDVDVGDSIAVNGACLTATTVNTSAKEFTADVSPETLRVTTLGHLRIGDTVNLERAMRLDARLGGHMVAGHVDCVGKVAAKRPAGKGFLMAFQVESGRYLIEKGSVAIDGVSLTVNRVEDARFEVMIIPHTALWTGLTGKNINDKVNVEFDLIGKYVEKFLSAWAGKSRIDEQKLRDYGFM